MLSVLPQEEMWASVLKCAHTRRLTQTHIGLVDCGAFCITFKIHFITDLGVFQVCGLVTNMVKLTQNKW